jgi:hypothetical protein
MTKIKNFRITLRSRDMLRHIKAQEGDAFDPQWELKIEEAIPQLKAFVQPAAVYTTLAASTVSKTFPIELPRKAVALSALVATIGSHLQEERAKAHAAQDTVRDTLLAATEKEALDQTVAFVWRLLQTQAKDEDCELLEPLSWPEPDMRDRFTTLLGVSRIGLGGESGPVELPSYARLIGVIWMPAGKAARGTTKPSPKARAEKAAV